jgi:hypothetical protein
MRPKPEPTQAPYRSLRLPVLNKIGCTLPETSAIGFVGMSSSGFPSRAAVQATIVDTLTRNGRTMTRKEIQQEVAKVYKLPRLFDRVSWELTRLKKARKIKHAGHGLWGP